MTRKGKNRDLRDYKKHMQYYLQNNCDGLESHKAYQQEMLRKQKKRHNKQKRLVTAHRRTMATIYSYASHSDSYSDYSHSEQNSNPGSTYETNQNPKSVLKKSQYADSDNSNRLNRGGSKKSVRIADFNDASPEKKSHFKNKKRSGGLEADKENLGDGGSRKNLDAKKVLFESVEELGKETDTKVSKRRKTQMPRMKKKIQDFKSRQSLGV